MFQQLRGLAVEKPLLFSLAAVLLTLFAGTAGVLIGMLLSGDPMNGMLPQRAGKIASWLFCLLLLARWDALADAGVSRFGGPPLLILTAALAFYAAGAVTWSFFGEFVFTVPTTAAGRSMIFQQLATGLFEEFLFRGVMFYGLMLAWGRDSRGALKAALLSAVWFGLLHLAYAGSEPASVVLLNSAAAALSGFWYAAVVWRFKSIWPVVLFHALGNLLVLANSAGYPIVPHAYLRSMLTELPLAILALLWFKEAALQPHQHHQAA